MILPIYGKYVFIEDNCIGNDENSWNKKLMKKLKNWKINLEYWKLQIANTKTKLINSNMKWIWMKYRMYNHDFSLILRLYFNNRTECINYSQYRQLWLHQHPQKPSVTLAPCIFYSSIDLTGCPGFYTLDYRSESMFISSNNFIQKWVSLWRSNSISYIQNRISTFLGFSSYETGFWNIWMILKVLKLLFMTWIFMT